MTLADTLRTGADIAATAVLGLPHGPVRDVVAILQAALGVSATMAKAGLTRQQIVDRIRRVPSLDSRVAAQDAAVDAAVDAKPSRDDESTARHDTTPPESQR